MLQINKIVIFLTFFVLCVFAGKGNYTDSIDWIIEDALEEEFIALESSEIITSEDFKYALKYYRDGDYRQAAAILDNLLNLNLPDGRTGFIAFITAECFRKLAMNEKSLNAYKYVIKRFPDSDKVPAAYFRILQFSYENMETSFADSILAIFEQSYKIHPLYNSVLYVIGKTYFQAERYGEASTLLLKIPRTSIRHFQAQFLAALSFVQLKKYEKVLLILEYIRQNSVDQDLIANANVLMGDIFFMQKNYTTALTYYRAVRKENTLYNYAQVKMARIYMKNKNHQKARDIARPFLGKGRKSEFFFEMATILGEIYTSEGQKDKASRIKKLADKQNINARLSFEISEELVRLYKIIRSWRIIEYKGLERKDSKLVKEARKNIKQSQNLRKKYRVVLYEIGAISSPDIEVEGLAQQRYITLLRKNITGIENSVQKAKDESNKMSEIEKDKKIDSPVVKKKDSLVVKDKDSLLVRDKIKKSEWIDSVIYDLAEKRQEYDKLKKVFIESGSEAERYGRQMQAKYVDWAFMRYQEKKEELEKMQEEIVSRSRQKLEEEGPDTITRETAVHDSVIKDKVSERKKPFAPEKEVDVVSLFTSIDIDKLIKSIRDDRIRLGEHIEMLLDASPGSSFSPQVLFRLAELYYDEASEDFDRRLLEYEMLMEKGGDSLTIEFPGYSLAKAIKVYDMIIANYPKDWLADDAMFFKALALKKLGYEEDAKDNFIQLINTYPESEYFVEANMNIGSYFFANPMVEGNKGYKLAEEAYRRVLQFRDHPQFVYAIYHLGWCYYMQDQYSDAIAVFKYLIEEVDLDFDITKFEEKQVLNPLMREEAIDYIAISFNEQDDIEGAIKFLTLIGNIDYAAKVFKRIGELREEDLDFDAAVKVYLRLINEYALSGASPEASLSMIKIFESNNKHQQAMQERENYFKRYARGTAWHAENVKKDTTRIAVVDSMTIAMGLFVADEMYRKAEEQGNSQLYMRALENYEKLVSSYPDNPTASEALWNFAVILDKKINDKKRAYKAYIAYSRLEQADQKRREQAALNAIGIAQSLLPADSLVTTGKVETVAVKVIEAAKNYLEFFPEGESFTDVVMNMGSVYFNRKMYSNAVETYKIITRRGEKDKKYYDAVFIISKCYFGEEKWTKAATGFEKIWKESSDELQRNGAFKLLLQSKFLYAKQLFDAGAYEKAALAYFDIDKKYPQSEYCDISLFNAAEAYEKKEDWQKACDMYFKLFKSYPDSKLAPEALFNAATNYEKMKNHKNAAEMYELIVNGYPGAEKAKDALFNVGFSYEKLGKIDRMAEANERYTQLYPGEKDVEAMLLRSAEYYHKSSMYEKSIKVYRNYIARYPNQAKTVEAYYMIGRCYLDDGDELNATLAFDQAESRNIKLIGNKQKGNSFYAGEAAFSLAELMQSDFTEVSFNVLPKLIKEKQELKTEKLSKAVKAYQRVLKYKSVRMFEAAYHVGEMYEEYAHSWSTQKTGRMDPIKLAVAQKDINLASSKLLKKSFEPYQKVIDLTKGLDTLSPDQQKWADTSKTRLINNYFGAGKYMANAVAAMQNAPIPEEIRQQPLYLFQYKKQMFETMEPLKIQIRDYYNEAYKELKGLAISKKAEDKCLDKFGQLVFLIPNDYDKLAEEILASVEAFPEDMDEEEREELAFQFEDLVFELQDKALFSYEDALEIAKSENLAQTKWLNKLYERLARLSPETYGKTFYATKIIETDGEWVAHTDSVKYWKASDPYGMGWEQVKIVSRGDVPTFTTGNPEVVWGDKSSDRIFLWRNAFLNGVPREGSIYLACGGKYRLYLNGQLLSSDTTGLRKLNQLDSITGILSQLKGGDNVIAVEVSDTDSLKRGFSLVFHALIDTSQSFKSQAMEPKVKKIIMPKLTADSTAKLVDSTAEAVRESKSYAELFKNKGELLSAIAEFQKKAENTEQKIRKERMEAQKLHIKIDNFNERIKAVKKEKEDLKKKKKDLSREK